MSIGSIIVGKPNIPLPPFFTESASAEFKTWPGAQVYRINAVTRREGKPISVRLVPFADAGMTGARYKVWLPIAGTPSANVLLDGIEISSRQGNQTGSINDDDPGSFAVTFDGKHAKEDWFAVTLDAPANIRRIVFVHGKNFHDGGWFIGKPMVQIMRERVGAWETVGELADYPADGKKLKTGQTFTLKLPEAVKAFAVRVIGTPASGDNPQQAFASCAELQAFAE